MADVLLEKRSRAFYAIFAIQVMYVLVEEGENGLFRERALVLHPADDANNAGLTDRFICGIAYCSRCMYEFIFFQRSSRSDVGVLFFFPFFK